MIDELLSREFRTQYNLSNLEKSGFEQGKLGHTISMNLYFCLKCGLTADKFRCQPVERREQCPKDN